MPGKAGRSGRPRKPTALKLLEGNPGRRPLPEDEPRPAVKLPTPPTQLSRAAKVEWRKTGRALADLGLMSQIDRAAFAAYCTCYTQWLEVVDLVAKSSVVVRLENGRVGANPLLGVAATLQAQWMQALREFGMTPAARSRVKGAAPVTPADDLDSFLSAARNG